MLAEDAAPTGRLTADDHAGCHFQTAFQPQWRLRLGVVSAASRHLQLALQLRRGLGRLPSYYKAVLLTSMQPDERGGLTANRMARS